MTVTATPSDKLTKNIFKKSSCPYLPDALGVNTQQAHLSSGLTEAQTRVFLWPDDWISNASHLDTLWTFTGQTSTSSSDGWGARPVIQRWRIFHKAGDSSVFLFVENPVESDIM